MNADAGGVSAMALLERMFAVELRFLQQDKADLDLLATAFHPDVVVHEPASLPYAGDWCGLDGIERLFRAMRATWSELSVDGLQAAMTGDTVFMTCNLRLTARSTGRPLTQPFAEVLHFEDGRLIEGRPFYFDTAAIRAALT
jgi:ketosteroid isomerase-like protein